MLPRLADPRVMLAIAIALLLAGFGAGWAINGWRQAAALQQCRAESAGRDAQAAHNALQQVQHAASAVASAASSAAAASARAARANEAARRQWQEAVARTPLPAGCRRDAARVQALGDAITRTEEQMP